MKHSLAALCAIALLGTASVQADSILGPPGSGQPTNTVLGTATGAAIGAAIGQTGGKDGWWIGSLVGGLVGGALGNSIPTDGYSSGYAAPASYSYSSYSVGYGYSSRRHCGPRYHHRPYFSHHVVYSPPPVVVREVVVEEPVVYTPPPPGGPGRSALRPTCATMAPSNPPGRISP
ncbi:MAG: hypothetical protein HC901_01580 [Bdellovibrionaceae bacterium]|nr:hypothetical protein [Pseudobdellovibrionaceae bacterium]